MTYRVFRREYRRLFLRDAVAAFVLWFDWARRHGEVSRRVDMEAAAVGYDNEPHIKLLQGGA
jgi:hypothetical protein